MDFNNKTEQGFGGEFSTGNTFDNSQNFGATNTFDNSQNFGATNTFDNNQNFGGNNTYSNNAYSAPNAAPGNGVYTPNPAPGNGVYTPNPPQNGGVYTPNPAPVNNTYNNSYSGGNSYYSNPTPPGDFDRFGTFGGQKETPVTVGDWLLSYLVMCIPCVGQIMMFVWAFSGSTKKSKSNHFKAMLIWMLIGIVLYIVMIFAMGGFGVFIAALEGSSY